MTTPHGQPLVKTHEVAEDGARQVLNVIQIKSDLTVGLVRGQSGKQLSNPVGPKLVQASAVHEPDDGAAAVGRNVQAGIQRVGGHYRMPFYLVRWSTRKRQRAHDGRIVGGDYTNPTCES